MKAWTLALAIAGLAPHVGAAERPSLVQTVDLLVPLRPLVVPIDGRRHLVHELHVTNFLAVDVALRRVEVLRADAPRDTIAGYAGEALRGVLGRPGIRRDAAPPLHVIGPGMRAVVFVWAPLEDAIGTPQAVAHRVELEVMRDPPVRAVTEGGRAEVSRDALPVLGPPLRGGPWAAIYDPSLMGGHRTAFYTLDGRARIPGRFAIDWVLLTPQETMEKTARGWNGFGSEVLAVADATVSAAADDIPENDPGPWPGASRIENASGNHVALDLGGGRFAFYEHLASGSVAVKPGDRVRKGQVIGRLGNSGSSSIGPHLHFHVADRSALLAAEGLPFVFADFEDLGAFASIDALVAGERRREAPQGARRGERPRANAVVRFR